MGGDLVVLAVVLFGGGARGRRDWVTLGGSVLDWLAVAGGGWVRLAGWLAG